MTVDGYITMSVKLNVCCLDTDSIEIGDYGEILIVNPDKFFMDWVDAWNDGNGELLGVVDENKNLEIV